MQIDWLTVGAQIANFLVLVWLLQRFLYAPIIGAMERREQRIADRLRAAERKEEEADAEARRYRESQAELERRREAVLAEAQEAAEADRRERERAARKEVEARKRQWLKQLDAERDEFLRELRRHAAAQFWRLARRALGDLASAGLEERIALSFAEQLAALDEEARAKIAAAADQAGGVTIRSRFELPEDARRRLAQAIHEHFREETEIDCAVDETVICGIELRAGSQTVGWSLASYLDGLERAVGEQVGRLAAPAQERAAE